MTTILRKRQRTNYTIVANQILEDGRLSFKARGIAAFLLSKPDDWNISWKNLADSAPEGRDSILAGMTELKEHGYLTREKLQNERGQWYTTVLIADHPQEDWLEALKQPDTDNPYSDTLEEPADNPDSEVEEPSTDFPAVGKPVLILNTVDQSLTTNCATHNTGKPVTEHQQMFGELCRVVGWNSQTLSQKDQARVGRAASKLLKAHYTVSDVVEFENYWYARDWRSKDKSGTPQFPSVETVQSDIGKIHAKQPEITHRANGKTSKVARSLAACDEVERMLIEQGVLHA